MLLRFCTPRTLTRLTLACVILLLAVICLAQTPAPQTQRPRKVYPDEQEPAEVVRFDTDLVSVDVTATDQDGRPVRTLQQNNFKVFLDGTEQPISFFQVERREGETRPLAVVFTLDVSGSMTGEEMNRLRMALQSFSNQLAGKSVMYAVMSFGMRVKTLQNFTTEPTKLDEAMERISRDAQNGLSTHAYDAVDDAIRLLVRHAPRTRERRLMRRAVLVVTDGFPVGDTVAPETVIERANAADVSVFVVTLPSYSRAFISGDQTPLPTPLDVSGLAEMTGGRNVYANERDYGPLFRSLAEEVSSAYVLAFYPPEVKRRDGQLHTLRVEGPAGLKLRQSRTEYRAPKNQ
ncbi:MAG: hypothetical protein C5B55_04160 [Blastocatellia bacterium]|nr:MAG: hypothetical protein C5B55_04160 [Blastocatellia bacterium]